MMPNKFNSHKKANAKNGEAGYSLLELMIAMVIFLIVTGAIYGVLQVAQRSRSITNQQVQLTKNVRVAINLLGRDTYNAGFGYPLPQKSIVVLPDNRISTLIGIPNDYDNSRDTVPPIVVGNELNANTYNQTANWKTDQITFLFKDSSFNVVNGISQPLAINAATTTGTGIDEIVPISGSNSVCRVNDIYLITGNTGSTLGLSTALSGSDKVQFSNNDVLGLNQTGSSGPMRGITTPASLQRVKMATYFVTTDGTLIRREYANVPPTGGNPAQRSNDEPLVYGVEDFQIKYVLEDGTLSDDPSAGADNTPGTADDVIANLGKVRQVIFTIKVRNAEKNAAGQFQRATMTSTFSTRNLGYDAN